MQYLEESPMIKTIINRAKNKYASMSTAVKAALWFTVCNLIQRGINFLTMPIFTRIMPTADYGTYTIYNSWYSIIVIFASLNLSSFVFSKGMVKYNEDRDTFELSLQSLNLTITAGLFLLYLIMHKFVNQFTGLSTIIMYLMFAEIAVEPSIHYWTARNRFEYKYKHVVGVTLGIALSNLILGIILVLLLPDPALARILSIVVVAIIFGTVFIISIIKKAKNYFSTKYWKYALTFNLPLIPHFLSASILNQSDRIMISQMIGKPEAAIYSVAYAIGMFPMLLSTAVQQSFLPWLYPKMKRGDDSKISEVTTATLILMAAVILGIISFGPEVITLAAPAEYQLARWIIPPVCGSVFFVFLQNMYANVEYYYEETKLIAAVSVGVAILNIILNFIFINKYGFIAAGYTTLFCYIVYTIAHYYVMVHICHKNKCDLTLFDMKKIVTVSLVLLVAIFGITAVYDVWIARYAIILGVCIFVYAKRKTILQTYKMMKSKDVK